MRARNISFALTLVSFLLWSSQSKADFYQQSEYSTSDSGYYSSSGNYSSHHSHYRKSRAPVVETRYIKYEPETRPVRKAKTYHAQRPSYSSRLPSAIATKEKTIVIDPKVHAWGAYSSDGKLLRAGLATSGASWCPDIGRPCRTKSGVFRISSLGNEDCISKKYPVGEGGAPMPYCMYFNGGQGLHGSNDLAEANLSHGCVRISVNDARWLRYNFSNVGTKVVVKSY